MKSWRVARVLAVVCWSVSAQDFLAGAPTEAVGIRQEVLGAVPLAPYADLLNDGQLRAREVFLEPGAKVAVHDHSIPPSAAYVLEGEIVEHRNDSDTPIVRRKGDIYLEGVDLVHRVENVSSKPAWMLSVDIVPTEAGKPL